MAEPKYYPFQPEKILHWGLLSLGGSTLIAGGVLFLFWVGSMPPSVPLEPQERQQTQIQPLSFALDLHQETPRFPMPDVEREMVFSFDPPRPDASLSKSPLFVRLTKTAQSKRVALPSFLALHYENGLRFAKEGASSFWVELRDLGSYQIEGKVFVSLGEDPVQAKAFVATVQENPIQLPHELPENSPFRLLAEARWWGHDLLREKYGNGPLVQRFEVGPLLNADLLELKEEDWIAWQEGKWQKIGNLDEGKGRPIARLKERTKEGILLEGWDLEGHVRFKLPLAQSLALKTKGEELLSAVRIRSEKQISCMIEKQCLILRVGDWVLKGDNRWRVLRKKEEREAFLSGKGMGDLFVFERIEPKGGQKVVLGQLFNAGRSQVVPIELAVSAQKKPSRSREVSWWDKGKRTGK